MLQIYLRYSSDLAFDSFKYVLSHENVCACWCTFSSYCVYFYLYIVSAVKHNLLKWASEILLLCGFLFFMICCFAGHWAFYGQLQCLHCLRYWCIAIRRNVFDNIELIIETRRVLKIQYMFFHMWLEVQIDIFRYICCWAINKTNYWQAMFPFFVSFRLKTIVSCFGFVCNWGIY